jgi:hypothetical protein
MTVVPDTLSEALSPAWLTAALQPRFPGIEVVTVTPGPVVDRISTNARFEIDCADAVPAELPSRLCVKGYFNDIGRPARFIGEPEAYFYRDMAEATGVRTLRPVYADVEQMSGHGVVITTDVAAEGAEFLVGRSAFTPEQAAQSLGELARLHAATWGKRQWSAAHWLTPRIGKVFESWGMDRTMSIIAGNLNGPNGSGVPEEMRDQHRLIDTYRAMAASAVAEASPWCVIDGDPHVGNLFLDAQGIPHILDWQLVQRGWWSIDVGYHIASTLTADDRRSAERDLLRHYLDRLRSFGTEPPPWDDAWRALRQGILQGFFLWAITTKVEPAVIEILLHRLGTAAADFDALSAVEVTR